MDMAAALTMLDDFREGGVTSRINALALTLADACGEDCERRLQAIGAQSDMLHAALVVKQASAQIDTILHALGMALALPRILEADERVLHLSLGAGTSDGRFDLETDRPQNSSLFSGEAATPSDRLGYSKTFTISPRSIRTRLDTCTFSTENA